MLRLYYISELCNFKYCFRYNMEEGWRMISIRGCSALLPVFGFPKLCCSQASSFMRAIPCQTTKLSKSTLIISSTCRYKTFQKFLDSIRMPIFHIRSVWIVAKWELTQRPHWECFDLQINTAKGILDTILSVQPKESTGGKPGETREAIVYKIAEDMLRKLPRDYVPHEIKESLIRLGGLLPMNIFLRQEIDRMQKILTIGESTA